MVGKTRLLAKIRPYSDKLTVLSHPYRVAIIYLLLSKQRETREIVRELKAPPAVAAFHLKKLVSSGWLLKQNVSGKHVEYRLNLKILRTLFKGFRETPLGMNVFDIQGN
ncbi:MAG: ArsR family transcriptional regulator [bacterium]|nr:ArsR family transcriptional regulator [bacterium]